VGTSTHLVPTSKSTLFSIRAAAISKYAVWTVSRAVGFAELTVLVNGDRKTDALERDLVRMRASAEAGGQNISDHLLLPHTRLIGVTICPMKPNVEAGS
jgi:hypothetical protein